MDLYACIRQAQESSNEASAILLLDIEKAFDSVSLVFLQDVLETFGFPPYFCDWMQVLYRDKELRVVNNGHASEVVYPTNGVAQGCGLSPMLYILVMEILALSIRNNEDIRGISLPSFEKKLSMLADDALLTLKVTRQVFAAVLKTLHEFALLSNLRVNLAKSTLIPLTCWDEVVRYISRFSN